MDKVCKNKYFCADNKRFCEIMYDNFSEEKYAEMIQRLFVRFPSFQKAGAGAYKPGIANMEFADQLMGHPHRKYQVVHVAGTNGKGSVSNMLASCLAASGLKVGLYTSPHILDFRERIRIVKDGAYMLIPKEDVWSFIGQWQETFDHLDMSFFEITTLLALNWFADRDVDIVVLETGLGGRLDSTNIVSPVLSVITNIGLDHCDMLGGTLPEIAFEKAGIIKPKVPVVIGENHPETDPVFERKVLYTNLPEPEYMGNRTAIMSLLTFADKVEPALWAEHDEILAEMDLQGEYQRKNLRTVLAALDVLSRQFLTGASSTDLRDALIHTASRTGFRGRWEKVSDNPWVICDIGHNEHGLKYNFAQLKKMRSSGEFTHLIVVYGSVADKDVDAVMHLMPEGASYIFTQAVGKRALPAEDVMGKYLSFCKEAGRSSDDVMAIPDVREAVQAAQRSADDIVKSSASFKPLIYIGGSTYVVSEAVQVLNQ